ncbi:MAG: hypothetical protein ACOC0N_12660 [Chroococcales cyanobacterium]
MITFGLVLLSGLAKASPPTPSSTNYLWDYAHVGSSSVVCKQVTFSPKASPLPKSDGKQAIHIHSRIVNDSYCDSLTKPASSLVN